MSRQLDAVSILPGRIRWRVPLIRDTPALAEELAVELRVLPGVTDVTTNATTGGVLVEFHEHRSIESVVAEVTVCVESLALRPPTFTERSESPGEPVLDIDGRWLRNAVLATAGFAAASAISSTLGSIMLWGGAAAAIVGGVRRASRELREESTVDAGSDPVVALWRRYGKSIVAPTVSTLFVRLFDLALPFCIGLAVDILATGPVTWIAALGITTAGGQIAFAAMLLMIGAALSSAFEYVQWRLWRRLGQRIRMDMRVEVYNHVQTLDLAYIEGKSSGELLNLLLEDVDRVSRFFDRQAMEAASALTVLLIPLLALIFLPPAIALLLFLPLPLTIVSSRWFRKRLGRVYDDVRAVSDRLALELSTSLNGLVTIRSFTAEERVAAQIAETSNVYRLGNDSASRLAAAFNPVMRMWVALGFDLVLLTVGLFASKTPLPVGLFSGMVYASFRTWYPLTRLGDLFDELTHARAALTRIHALLDTQPTIIGGSEVLPGHGRGAEVVFDSISFEYAGAGGAISDVSFHAGAGETLAIVGPTGAGKTTISKLLLRFYDPAAGSISIDGHDLRDLTLESLRGAISLVTQDAYLFHGTIRENIAMGEEGATLDDVMAAARVALAHDFIMAMPDGYDTVVGERGIRLSGGERQRVAIARAVLKDAPILILDEATSAIDSRTEAALLDALAAATPGRTKIVIAHRLSTVQSAGEIVVLKNGAVCERGNHESLLARNGVYAAFWQLQIGAGVNNGQS
ncbi:MAG: ATP-binding cassette, subfamily bacterial [Thermoanaerobaculia bacterium]|jgi:ATP-binding cassette subfamily B protein|nr:ATP-binding cassette, subfamily bacterial [Thermoanaerobaculia bacterium]